jgi:hypothetical protein
MFLLVPLLLYGCGSSGGGGGDLAAATDSGTGTATVGISNPDADVIAANQVQTDADATGGTTGGTTGTGDTGTGDTGDTGTGDTGTGDTGTTDPNPKDPKDGNSGKGKDFSYVKKLLVTFDCIEVHKVGYGWISLPLLVSPYTVDLLEFSNGKKTQLIPPAVLPAGKYTQVRIGVAAAAIVTDTNETIPVTVPSDCLKTSSEFEFEVNGGGVADLIIAFSASRSLVVTGSGKYKLKPVLHLVKASEAATVAGSITPSTFGSYTTAKVVVIRDKNKNGFIDDGEGIYTCVFVNKASTGNTPFSVKWLAPYESYIVQLYIGGNYVGEELIFASSLPPGAIFALNQGDPI